MTIEQSTSYLRLFVVFLGLQIFTHAAAQGVYVEISVDVGSKTASVRGRLADGFLPSSRNLAFKRDVAGAPDLAGRIRDVQLTGIGSAAVDVRKLMNGEYLAGGEYAGWNYTVDLTAIKDRTAAAHASWIAESGGILMLDDLLPRLSADTASIKLKLPDGWNYVSADAFQAVDPQRSVIFIGKGMRTLDVQTKSGELKMLIAGDWHFSDQEAADMSREILDEYSKMLGSLPSGKYLIGVTRFPTVEQSGQWQAETRGRTVTIISSDMPFKTQSIQRLHEQLRHEIFHLWFPNGVNLSGDYAWFYEGFAMYSSLKLAVKLNRIRFDDFLDTLGRAYTIDVNAKPRKALTDPAIDATVRYARGMLLAFMTDLKALGTSNGRDDVNERLRKLFVEYSRLSHGSDADVALRTVVTDPSFFRKYIEGADPIEWTAELAAAGIEAKQTGRTATIAVAAKPNGRQRAILDRLGYNNWRKIGNRK